MAVANEGTGTPNIFGSGVTSLSLTTFTVGSGANRLLVASMLFAVNTVSAITLTWDSVSMTQALSFDDLFTLETFYVLIAPNAGNKTLAASWTTSSSATLAASEYSGADQATGFKAADNVTAGPNTNAVTVSVTSTTDGATVAASANEFAFLISQTQTVIYQGDDSGLATGSTYAIGGTSNDHTFQSNGVNISAIGIHLLAASAAAAAPGRHGMLLAGIRNRALQQA